MNRTQLVIENLCTIFGAVFMAALSKSDFGVVIGSCVAGAGIMSILGMLLSEAIPALKVSKLAGYRRMLANWLCGIFSIPFVPWMHRNWFEEEDLAMTAAGIAGIFALLGVSLFTIMLPKFIGLFQRSADAAISKADQWIPQNQTAPTVKLADKPTGTDKPQGS